MSRPTLTGAALAASLAADKAEEVASAFTGECTDAAYDARSLVEDLRRLTEGLIELGADPPPPICSICRRRHGSEVRHACE